MMKCFIILFSALFFTLPTFAQEVLSTYITFEKEDTSSSVTVNLYLKGDTPSAELYYDIKSSNDRRPESYANKVISKSKRIKKTSRSVVSFQINDLTPFTDYYFIAGNKTMGYGEEFKFRTIPNDDSPIRIVQGGDMSTSHVINDISDVALAYEPHVILVGGDIAYADGSTRKVGKWDKWFSIMNRSMKTPDNYLVPLILAIGNHETNFFSFGGNRIPFFFNLFPQHGKRSYFKRKLGKNTMLYVLDTGHATTQVGDQKDWMKEHMRKDQEVNKLALYHIPLYPSHRSYRTPGSQVNRSAWLNIFEKNKLKLAFENHDHTVKRTHMLKDGKIVDKDGIIYVGDGCWGKTTRSAEERWYLKVSQSKKHVWNVLIDGNNISMEATGIKGAVFDKFTLNTKNGNRVIEN